VDRNIRDEALPRYPLHSHQHAYKTMTSGKEHSSFIYKIERALEDGPVTLAAFLDKEGEFDNTTMAAEEYGVERGVLI
jgi:hypothetical protein